MLLIDIFEKAVDRKNSLYQEVGTKEKLEILCSDVFYPIAVMKYTNNKIVKYNLYTLNSEKSLQLIRTFKSLENATNALHALAITEK